MDKDILLVVPSCDAYQDLWAEFLRLLERFWPGSTRRCLILSNEVLSDHVCTLRLGPDMGWCENLYRALDRIPDEEFLMILENHFAITPIDTHAILQGWKLFQEKSSMGALYLTNRYTSRLDLGFPWVAPTDPPLVSLVPAFWRKAFIRGILDHLSKTLKEKPLYEIRKNEPDPYSGPYGRPIEFEIIGGDFLRTPGCPWECWTFASPKRIWPFPFSDTTSFGKWRKGLYEVWAEWGISWDLGGRPMEGEEKFYAESISLRPVSSLANSVGAPRG